MNSASSFVNAYKIAGYIISGGCMPSIACKDYRNGCRAERAHVGRK